VNKPCGVTRGLS